ncbi:MAG: type II toxin-antitoxin system HicA family toxin [Bryobacteraceae bacterium]
MKRRLEGEGCTFAPGKGGHLKVFRGAKRPVLPTHGAGRELPRALVHAVLKQLGLR